MVGQVARKEFLLNLMTLRFAVAVAICVTMMTASAGILVGDYTRAVESHGETVERHRQELGNITVFSEVKSWADRPPSPLSVLCLGKDGISGSSIRVRHMEVPTGGVGRGTHGNPLLRIFADVDPVQVVEVLVSLLVLLFAYDAVSAERERGTLTLMFSNAVKRPEFLLGKYLGGVATVGIPIVLGVLLATVVALGSPWIRLNLDTSLRIASLTIVSILYASAFYLLGLVVSSRVQRSSTSLILLFFVWIFLVIIVPDTSAYVARRLRPVTSSQVFLAREEALQDAFWREMRKRGEERPFGQIVQDYKKGHPEVDLKNLSPWELMVGRHVWSGAIPYAFTCMFAPREMMEWFRDGTLWGVRRRLEYAQQQWDVHRQYLGERKRQAVVARWIAAISPARTYRDLTEIFAGTDVGTQVQFSEQARRYRQDLLRYIENGGGFTSIAYFTRMEPTDLRPIDELMPVLAAGGKEAIRELARPWTEDLDPLPGIPEFRYRPETWAESLERAAPAAGWLIALNGILLVLAYASFHRQDLHQTGS